MTDPLTLTKLIILYMLNKAGNPVLKTHVFSFIMDNDYTNYFTLMQACTELCDNGLAETRIIMNGPHLAILDDGVETLSSFSDRISQPIKDDINNYLKACNLETKSSLNVNTNYYKASRNEFVAELNLKEEGSELLTLSISMPTEDSARAMCEPFDGKSEELYDLIVDKLL